jgi:tRNA-Thr(GGU) m(6)t(6)A37 methyltransferase TsaA
MKIEFKPIGFVKTDIKSVPRHWTVSDAEGMLVLDEKYTVGLKNVKQGQRIVVIFYFHKSPDFTQSFLTQKPPHLKEQLGVFSICSPIRPNPVGMSVLEVTKIEGNIIHVKGIDMFDGTPILDIKPYVEICKNKTASNEGRA